MIAEARDSQIHRQNKRWVPGTLTFNLALKFLEVVEQSLDEHAKGARELVVGVFDQFRDPRGDIADALGNDETELAEEATDLIGLRRARLHEALAHPVQCQHRLLLNILDRHEAHVRPTDSLADGLGVGCIILVGLDVWFDELGGSVALPVDKRVWGRNGCQFFKRDGFVLTIHKTGRQKTA